jgi:hypothetical protein
MQDFWNYIKSWFFHLWASLATIRPGTINWLVRSGRPKMAVGLLEGKFDQLAPWDERIASNDWYKKKWAFPQAAQFLVECKITAAAAVIHAYANHPQNSFRASVFVELLLTLPMFSKENEPEKWEKVNEILTLVAKINGSLMEDVLKKGQAKPAYELVSRVKEKEVPKALRFTPVETGAYLLRKLRTEDPDYYEVFEGKLHAEYAEKIKNHWHRDEFRRKSGRGWEDAPLRVESDEPEPERIEADAGKPAEEPPE